MIPAEPGQPAHEPVQEGSGIGVALRRPPGRVGHIILGGVAQQIAPFPVRVGARQPPGKRLARRPGPDPLTAPDELLQGERPGPDLRRGDDGVPDTLTGHAEYEFSRGEFGRGDRMASVRRRIEPVGGHDRDDLRQRRITITQHPG